MSLIGKIAPTHLWAIADAVPRGGIVVEWGSGESTKFLLDMSQLSELHTIEHDPFWRGRVCDECGKDSRFHMAYFHVGKDVEEESVKWLSDYSLAEGVPLDLADVIVVDGMSRSTCVATASVKAKVGALLFLHDSDSSLYKWSVRFMDMNPNWNQVEEIYTLPEDPIVAKMTVWRRTS